MATVFEISTKNTLYAAPRYPSSNSEAEKMGLSGKRNQEMRAMTIAAFRVAQNNDQISTQPMDKTLLLFLLAGSTTTISHWKKNDRLISIGDCLQLTPAGLAECQDSLLGLTGAYSTSEDTVREWVTRMLHGDHVATKILVFAANAWDT